MTSNQFLARNVVQGSLSCNVTFSVMYWIYRHTLLVYVLYNVACAVCWIAISLGICHHLDQHWNLRFLFVTSLTIFTAIGTVVCTLLCWNTSAMDYIVGGSFLKCLFFDLVAAIFVYGTSNTSEIDDDDFETVIVVRRMKGLLPVVATLALSLTILCILWMLHVPAVRCMRLRFPFQDGKYGLLRE